MRGVSSSTQGRLLPLEFRHAFAVSAGCVGLILVLGFVVLGEHYTSLVVAAAATIPLLFFYRPTLLLACYLFLIPLWPKLPLVPIPGYVVAVRLEDFCILVFLAIALVRRAVYGGSGLPYQFVKPVLVFLLLCLLSTAWGVAILGAVGMQTGFLFFIRLAEYFSVALISFTLIRDNIQLEKLLLGLGAACLAVNIYAILQEFAVVPVFNATHMDGEFVTIYYLTEGFGSDRLFSTFAGPVDLAGFYVVVIPTFMILALEQTLSKLARVAWSLLFGVSLLCMYLTYSRGALAGLGLSLGAALWLTGRWRLSMMLVPLTLLPALLFGGFLERLGELQNLGSRASSFTERFQELWVPAWSSFFRSPLIGTGLGSLRGEGFGIDGFYVFLLGMTGLLGLLAFLWIIRRVLETLNRLRNEGPSPTARCFACGLLASTIGLLVNAAFTDVFTLSKVAEVYWFLIGALFAIDAIVRRSRGAESSPGASFRLNLGVVPEGTP